VASTISNVTEICKEERAAGKPQKPPRDRQREVYGRGEKKEKPSNWGPGMVFHETGW